MARESIEHDRIALGVQQPWAELIVRGLKTIEVRSTATRIRGPIYVYASKRPSRLDAAVIAADRFGLAFSSLAVGVILGRVEITDCRPAVVADTVRARVEPDLLAGRFAWMLAEAERFDEPLEPRFSPYGIWFYPFRRKGT